MRDLVPIKIIVLRKRDVDGRATNDYPDFNKLPEEVRGGLDWCHAIDHYGIGMHYSRDGFGQGSDPHSQVCATCVPESFAKAAVEAYPDRVAFMSEREWESFYDDDAHSHEPEEHLDTPVLQAIAAKKTLGLEMTTGDMNAMNPDHPSPGIVKNRSRFWKDARELKAVNLKSLGDSSGIKTRVPQPTDLPSCC